MKKSLIVILVLLSVLFAAVTVLNAQEGGADIPVPESETAGADAAVSDGNGTGDPSDAVGLEQPAAEDPSDNEETDQDDEQPAAEEPSDNEENDQEDVQPAAEEPSDINNADPEEEQPEGPADPAADAAAAGAELTEEKEGMVVHIYGTRVTVEFSGEEKAAEGYRIEVTCGEIEGEEKNACEAYGREDFRYEGEASVNASEPGTYAMGLAAEQFVNENEAFEDVAFVVEEDGCLEITQKIEQPVAAEEPADEDDEEDEGSGGDQNEDPAPAENPADVDENTISYGTLTIHLTPVTEDNENEDPAVTTTTEDETDTVEGEEPVVTTTDEENTETVDDEEPAVTTTDEEETVTVDGEEPVVTTTDEEETVTVDGEEPVVTTNEEEETVTVDGEEPAVTTTDGEETDTVDGEEPVVTATDEENTETIDDEENDVTVVTDEDTVTADNEEPVITAAPEEDTVTVEVEEGSVSTTDAEDTETADEEDYQMISSGNENEASEEGEGQPAENAEEAGIGEMTAAIAAETQILSAANENGDVLFTAEADTELTVLAVEGDWALVQLEDGSMGYVALADIILPEKEEDAEAEAETVVVSGPVDIRLAADGMSEIIFTAEEGQELTILGVEGDWVKVQLADGTVGYVHVSVLPAEEEKDPAGSEEEIISVAEEKPVVEKKVTIFTSRRSQMAVGEEIRLTSLLEGFEDCSAIKYQWECDKGEGFEKVEGGDGESFSYEATVESMSWSWRLLVFYK